MSAVPENAGTLADDLRAIAANAQLVPYRSAAQIALLTAANRLDATAKEAHHAVRFDFRIGDRVTIVGSSIEADVVSLLKDREGESYSIAYWYGGSRTTVWVAAREIALIENLMAQVLAQTKLLK